MEPQFRFCTSADGTRIAYVTYGSGPPLLYANTWVLSIDAQFRIPEARAYFDALAARAQLVIFDRRGSGASERDVDDLSPEAEAQDIAAIADAAGIRDFALFADIATAVCATYALSNQQRLRNLVLWSPFSEISGGVSGETARLIRKDWSYYRRLWASRLFPQGPVSLQRALSKAFKDTASAEMAARRFEVGPLADLDALLPRVLAPVLLLQRETWARQQTIHLAALLPISQLRFVAGQPPTPYPDHEAIVEAVFEFMGLSEPASTGTATPDGTAIILFTDIVDSTALTERMGDAAFRAASRTLDEQLRLAIRDAGGTPVEGKVLGDGVMGAFTSAAQAIAAARACLEFGGELPMHIGLHAGDVIREKDNVYGGAVNIASRICGLCAPGEILVSQTVRDLARTSAGVTFEDRGEHALKGIEDPVRVFAVPPTSDLPPPASHD
jgi:class 3 adenylate cyclase/pimeloyl-ACP methyl ester carboxylesterase